MGSLGFSSGAHYPALSFPVSVLWKTGAEEGHSRASLSIGGYWGSGSQSTHESYMGDWVLTNEFGTYSDLSLFQEYPTLSFPVQDHNRQTDPSILADWSLPHSGSPMPCCPAAL